MSEGTDPEAEREGNWPDPAEEPAEEHGESLEDDGTPGTGTVTDPEAEEEPEEEELDKEDVEEVE